MAETTADVRRDIELTRERMSTTLQELEQKLNVMQIVRDNPWPALAIAVGAGVLLSGSGSDVKAAEATTSATKGASRRVGSMLDGVVASLVGGLSDAFESRVTAFVSDIKTAITEPTTRAGDGAGRGAGLARALADQSGPGTDRAGDTAVSLPQRAD